MNLNFMKRSFKILLLAFGSAVFCCGGCSSGPEKGENRLPEWALGGFVRPAGANPVITPDPQIRFFCPMRRDSVGWMESDTFNPAATVWDGKICVLFRAEDNSATGIGKRTSRIGLAETGDGVTMQLRHDPVLFPAEDNQKENEWPGGCEDPRVAMTEDGTYVMLYTAWNRRIPRLCVATSPDLVNWTKVGEVFTAGNHPQITDKAGANLWAPDINKIGDRYVLYYSQPGENNKHAIGVASGPSPVGPFTDHGKLIGSDEIGVDISIDQFYIEEDGHKYMFWGSFRGIWAIELADDGLSLKPGAGKRKIAGDQYEGTYIHKRDGYYYLIVSTGDFMKDYHVVVGRSRSLMGPYVDRAGRDMLGVHHELVVGNGNGFVAPGHNAEFVTDDKGQDWMLYHTRLEVGGPRYLILDRIEWNDGWPEVRGHVPARSAEAPVFE